MRRVAIVAVGLAVLIVGTVVYTRVSASGHSDVRVIEEPTPTPARTPEPIIVDVAGAVARPGVYRLAPGARIADALAAAGGMTEAADPNALNRAAPLRDGARLYVPRPGELIPAGSLGTDAEKKIDINRATAGELEALPGIGPSTAARIVRSRNARPFTRLEELQTRGLVTPRVFADIRELITLR